MCFTENTDICNYLMKKIVLTLLAFFYLGVSSGATVDIHFCMGKLIDWGISQSESEKCTNCGMEKGSSSDCCEDQQLKLTVKESPKASPVVYYFTSLSVYQTCTAYNISNFIDTSSLAESWAISDAPPRTKSVPAFIRNCTFRI